MKLSPVVPNCPGILLWNHRAYSSEQVPVQMVLNTILWAYIRWFSGNGVSIWESGTVVDHATTLPASLAASGYDP
ncbi:hypothetical protein DXG01_008180 [Tephrocybe rancida]|nr:hypothetical protein DXG01_008180 [Tephrocybe rancida]